MALAVGAMRRPRVPPQWTGLVDRRPLAARIAQAKREVATQEAPTVRAGCLECGQSGPRGVEWATTHSLRTGHETFTLRSA